MSKIEKLVERFLRCPTEVDFSDVVKILNYFGWREVNRKGSHFSYSDGERILTIPTKKGRKVKRAYIKKICEILDLEEWYEKRSKNY